MVPRLASVAILAAASVACSGVRPARVDDAEARADRGQLVARIAARRHVSAPVLEAIESVPRHLFVDAPSAEAYQDRILRIGWGQTISQPRVVAMMSDALELDGRQRVLEIGTGSGYQAAVLSRLARHVDSMELVPALADSARKRLHELSYRNVEVRTGDGYGGWPEHAPFDRIILTAAPPQIPDALYAQLREGGILVAPVGEKDGAQRLVRCRKRTAARPECEDLGPIAFVPMVHGN